MSEWKADDLRAALDALRASGKIRQWAVEEEELEREERYFLAEAGNTIGVDQSRQVKEISLFAKVEVEKGKKLGSARLPFYPRFALAKQVEDLLEAAHLGEEDIWAYPEKAEHFDKQSTATTGELFSEAEALSTSLRKGVAAEKKAKFNSSELFLTRRRKKLSLSNGFRGNSSTQEIYSEVCFSSENQSRGQADEFLVKKSGVSGDQFDFARMCAESAEFSAKLLDARPPEPGKYFVLFHSEDLCMLFNDVLRHLDSTSRYLNLPFIDRGGDLIPGFRGADFRLWLDPEAPRTFGARRFDEFGDSQRKILLVEKNKVANHMTNRKIANFLSAEPTTSSGAVAVETLQSMSEEDLRRAEPRVLEVLQFSALFSNASDLTFSSEIRLARLHEGGKTSYIKGGSLAGNFRENFQAVRWSNRNTVENLAEMNGPQSYVGPSMGLLSGVNISA